MLSMDWMKRLTIKNYTAWDLNCPNVHNPKSASKDRQKFKRTARRKDKQELRGY